MSTKLLLIRHGETKWNTLGKFQGCQDIELTENGILQAQMLHRRLQGDFDVIYTSPLRRAFLTAEIICASHPLSPIAEKDLTEIHFGSWEGLTYKEIRATYPEHFTKWQTDHEIGPLYDGEQSIKNACLRVENCLQKIIATHPNQKIAVISHGGLIKAALIALFNWHMGMYHQIALGNTCITTIHFNDEFTPILIGLNDTNHLNSTLPYSI